jgi:hypothetical protein
MILFTLERRQAYFAVISPNDVFKYHPIRQPIRFELWGDGQLLRPVRDPFEAFNLVEEHRTGVARWDRAQRRVPEDAWKCHVAEKVKANLVFDALRREGSYREVIDFFHSAHPYLMERTEIGYIIEELALTGQLDVLPSDHMVPAELRSTADNVQKWWDADRGAAN